LSEELESGAGFGVFFVLGASFGVSLELSFVLGVGRVPDFDVADGDDDSAASPRVAKTRKARALEK